MKLKINGAWTTVEEDVHTVGELLDHYDMNRKAVVVEQNEEILTQETRADQRLQDGDIIEIVHFVGGG